MLAKKNSADILNRIWHFIYLYMQHCAIVVNGSCKLSMLGPVVQSVVSLTSSLRVISLTVLADSIHNIDIFC